MSEETIFYQPEYGAHHLTVIEAGNLQDYDLDGELVLGRKTEKSKPDIAVSSGVVSRRHGRFLAGAAGCFYCDENSLNGTFLDGKKLDAGKAIPLSDGSILRIHGQEDEAGEMDVLLLYSAAKGNAKKWITLQLAEAAEIVIGREADMQLREKSVSRKHASLFYAEKGWSLIDHGSTNGVFLNNVRIKEPVYLHRNDVIRIAGYYFVFLGDTLLCQKDARAAEEAQTHPSASCTTPVSDISPVFDTPPIPDIPSASSYSVPQQQPDQRLSDGLSIYIEERNVWQRAKKKTLLRDIRLDISPGSMVLILGGSGAGKTTFMNAVMGYERADGIIRYAGTDIYQEYERMKYEIGYVPQQDLLRLNDSVYDTLKNAAAMKLPVMEDADYEVRVAQTLNLLGLDKLKDSLVGKLSGGQRKRLSIAVEYIGNPALFFLDEPDSGLDGTMARRLMENLRSIADQGKIVLVISHSPDRAADLFDQVIVLAKSSANEGRLVFYGTPDHALRFFEVRELEEIMGRINFPEEGGEGLSDLYIQKFEEGRI